MIIQDSRRRGFTLVETMIVVALIGVIALIGYPNIQRARTSTQKDICIENLAQIESAKQLWGMEKAKDGTSVPTDTDLIGAVLYLVKKPVCPGQGTYDYKAISVKPTCSQSAIGHTL